MTLLSGNSLTRPDLAEAASQVRIGTRQGDRGSGDGLAVGVGHEAGHHQFGRLRGASREAGLDELGHAPASGDSPVQDLDPGIVRGESPDELVFQPAERLRLLSAFMIPARLYRSLLVRQ